MYLCLKGRDKMSKLFIIDGTSYPVHLIDVKRKADILDSEAYRTEDGIYQPL